MTPTSSAAPPAFKTPEGEARYRKAYDAVLRAWPVPYQELDFPTRLGTTHLIASGAADAPPLVLLPSMAGSATLWRPNVAALSQAYRTYAVDVIGQAGKSVLGRRVRGREDFAGWFTDVLDALGVQRTSIVGSSYGAFLALNQAILTPERVDRVVLINPAGTFVGGLMWFYLKSMLVRMITRRKVRDITDMLGAGVTLAPEDEPWRALMRITIADSGRPSLIPPIVFKLDELAAVRAPALLLIGEKERLYDAHTALKRAKELMPALRAEIVPGAHHLAALARPDYVNDRILRFLEAAETARKNSVASVDSV